MRLPLGPWIWWKEIRAADRVAGRMSTGMVTRASGMWPDQKARAAMDHLFFGPPAFWRKDKGSTDRNDPGSPAPGVSVISRFSHWRNCFVLTTFLDQPAE